MEFSSDIFEEWLNSGSEDENLEFKEAKRQFKNKLLYEYCVAIANEGGGNLVLGVTDKLPRFVVGTIAFPEHKKISADIYAATNIKVFSKEHYHDGSRALIFFIPARDKGEPFSYQGKYMMRAGEGLVGMNNNELRRIFNENTDNVEKINGGRCYFSGRRLGELRELIGLSSSRWIDYLNFNSEKEWLSLEVGEKDIEEHILRKVVDMTGCSENWLLHGEGNPYPIKYLTTDQFEYMCDKWKKEFPQNLNILLCQDDMTLIFIDIRNKWHAKIYSTNFRLDFWNWFDDHRYVSEIYNSLKNIRSLCVSNAGTIDESSRYELLSGNIFPHDVLKELNNKYWFDDMFDINHKNDHLVCSYKAYGDWFIKLQESFRRWGA